MDFLPKASGNRPRVACEIAPMGVVAARSDAPGGLLQAVASVALREGAVTPGLKPGNIADRLEVLDALRKTLEQVGARPNARNADITLVIPDAACRVLLLEFDALPNKLSEALPLVRFRLKKLVPFEADDAMVSFQILSQSRQVVRVLAVAIPRDVLAEYETLAREAGFEPGAVLPSTLAAMAGVDDGSPALLVNAHPVGVTTAIARDGILLLHRTVDLQREAVGTPANVPPAMFEPSAEEFTVLPLVDVDDTAGEWAMQEALPEHGRDPYAARAVLPDMYAEGGEAAPVTASVYAQPTVAADLNAELHHASLYAPTAEGTLTERGVRVERAAAAAVAAGLSAQAQAVDYAAEVAQSVSVAAAYYEDNLQAPPTTVLSAGSLGAAGLQRVLEQGGMGEYLRVREVVDANALAADSVSARVPRGLLAGVMGALRS